MQNLIDIMIMLCMRPANRITFQTGTTLNILGTAPDMLKTKIMNLDHFYLWKKNPVRARELLIWIQKAIPKRFPFLLKDEDDNVSVHPINNFLASYSISSSFQSAWR